MFALILAPSFQRDGSQAVAPHAGWDDTEQCLALGWGPEKRPPGFAGAVDVETQTHEALAGGAGLKLRSHWEEDEDRPSEECVACGGGGDGVYTSVAWFTALASGAGLGGLQPSALSTLSSASAAGMLARHSASRDVLGTSLWPSLCCERWGPRPISRRRCGTAFVRDTHGFPSDWSRLLDYRRAVAEACVLPSGSQVVGP